MNRTNEVNDLASFTHRRPENDDAEPGGDGHLGQLRDVDRVHQLEEGHHRVVQLVEPAHEDARGLAVVGQLLHEGLVHLEAMNVVVIKVIM